MNHSSEPRSVAMILNSPGFGGVPLVVNEIVSRLDRHRFTPSVYFLKGFADEKNKNSERLRDLMTQGITVDGASESGGKIGVITQLTSWLKQHRIDILHTHSFRPNLYGRMAGALSRPDGLLLVSHYHNQYDDKWLENPASLELEQHLASITDAMIAVSESVCRHVSTRVGVDVCDIDVIGNGVTLPRFSHGDAVVGRRLLGVDGEQFCIGLVGRVCHQKGVDLFVHAAIKIAKQRPQYQFVIIGDIEDQALHAELQASIVSAELQNAIRFVGHIDDMPPVFAALDLLVAPSRWEGFGLILVEAMAASVPIIATRIGSIPEVTGEGSAARLIETDNVDVLTNEIELVATDKTVREKLVRAGRGRAENFSWQLAVDKLSSVYDRLTKMPH